MTSEHDLEVHIFDCDGVLLDSNALKISSLRRSLESVGCHPALVDWAEQDFRRSFGRTRRAHFERFLEQAWSDGYELSKAQMEMAIVEYSKQVERLYKDCDVIVETANYMSGLSDSSQIFVVSASDQAELRDVLPEKFPCIAPDRIFGGPASKKQNIATVLDLHPYGERYFYGDSVQDAVAAASQQVQFMGLTKFSADKEGLTDYCSLHSLACFHDCSEIKL